MELITLKVLDSSIEAHILRSKLESEDIDAFVFDEHSISMNPLFTQALGGIRLKIRKEDHEKALSILKEIDETNYTNDLNEVIVCPKCGSDEYYSNFKSMKGGKGLLSILSAFIFSVYPIYYKTVYKCKKCNEEFTGE